MIITLIKKNLCKHLIICGNVLKIHLLFIYLYKKAMCEICVYFHSYLFAYTHVDNFMVYLKRFILKMRLVLNVSQSK